MDSNAAQPRSSYTESQQGYWHFMTDRRWVAGNRKQKVLTDFSLITVLVRVCVGLHVETWTQTGSRGGRIIEPPEWEVLDADVFTYVKWCSGFSFRSSSCVSWCVGFDDLSLLIDVSLFNQQLLCVEWFTQSKATSCWLTIDNKIINLVKSDPWSQWD